MSLTYEVTKQPIVIDTEDDSIVYIDNDDETGKKILETTGKLRLIPQIGTEDGQNAHNIYICGASGDGKSTKARDFAMTYKELYKKNKIFLITQSDESKIPEKDRIFYKKLNIYSNERYSDFLELQRTHVDSRILAQKFNIVDYTNSLLIFDDFLYCSGKDARETKAIKNKICSVIIEFLNNGRKSGISIIITSHTLYEKMNNDMYQNIYGEIHTLIFGKKTNKGQLRYALDKYFSFSPKMKTKIINFDKNSKMITLHRYPNCVISDNKMELLTE
jgi:hypothetical protein